MRYHLTQKSSNAKTGPIPVSTTSSDSCPVSCPMHDGGCYAKSGPLALHWAKIDKGERGMDEKTFLAAIRSLPDGQLWRHNQAGDLPGIGDTIDKASMIALIQANQGKRGFTYTHKPVDNILNYDLVRYANAKGFTVNVSTNSLAEADRMSECGLPVVTIMPDDTTEKVTLSSGVTVVVCPAQTGKAESCATCQLCARSNRKVIIGFRAHGTAKRKVINIAKGK